MNILPINNVTPVYRVQTINSTAKYIPELPQDTFVRSQKQPVQNPITKEREAYTPKKEYKDTITTLLSLQTRAETTYQHQINSMGWCGKLSDKISALWGSKNRSNIVFDDINQSRAQIENLDEAASNGNFRSEFFKTFGVNYNQEAIDDFEKEAQNYTLIKSASQMAVQATAELEKHIKFFDKNADSINPENPNFDKYKKHPDIAKKMGEFRECLEKYVGGSDNLKQLTTARRNDFDQLSREDQIAVYNEIAFGLIYTYNENSEKLKNGKSDKEIQKEYDKAYEKAFGKTNNIQKRVNDYVRAQQIQTVAMQDMAISGFIGAAIALTGTAAPALLGAGITTVGYLGFDISELATNKVDNKEDLSKENVKDIIKCSVISGAEYFVGSKLYDVIPKPNTGKQVLDTSLHVARTLGIELPVAFAAEYLRTGNWDKNQINPKTLISLTLSTLATEELVRMGLSSSNGSLKSECSHQAVSIEEKSFEKLSLLANKKLEKLFAKHPDKVMNLKLICTQNPDLFRELLAKALQESGNA